MTTYSSHAVDEHTADLLSLIADDARKAEPFAQFTAACRLVAAHHDGQVSPNWVRMELSNLHGLTIEPRLYSSFWSKACREGVLRWAGEWDTNTDTKGRNSGKPLRVYRLGGA